MDYTPLVSIVIPAYNSKNFIEHCIYSVIDQTYRNMEIIVVDDGSTDGTLQICQKFGSTIKIISQKNSGRGYARNTGIKNALGEYIAFLDSDDLLLTDSIMERVHFLENYKI